MLDVTRYQMKMQYGMSVQAVISIILLINNNSKDSSHRNHVTTCAYFDVKSVKTLANNITRIIFSN